MKILRHIVDRGTVQWVAYAVLLSSLSLLYFHGIDDLLTDIDDEFTFAANEPVKEDFGKFFTLSAQWAGRPTSAFFFLLGSLTWGSNPFWFHVLSVTVHTIVSLALAVTFRTMGFSRPQSFLAGSMFLINTSHFQAVHWITSLMYPLYVLYSLFFLISFLRYLSTGKTSWYAIAIISVICGVLANIATLSAVAFCAYVQVSRGATLRATAVRVGPVLALALMLSFVMMHISAEQVITSLVVENASSNFGNFLLNAGRNILLLLNRSIALAHWVTFPFYDQFDWELYVGFVVLVALVVIGLLRRPGYSDGAVWILVSVIPFLPIMLNPDVAQQVPQGPSRYLYAASGGTALMLSSLAESARRYKAGTLVFAALVTIVAASSYEAMLRVEGLSYYSSARNLTYEGNVNAAATQLERAIDQGDNAVPLLDAYVRLCKIRIARGGDYMSTLSQAIERFPNNPYLESAKRALNTFEEHRSRGEFEYWQPDQKVVKVPNLGSFLASLFSNLGVRYAEQQNREASILASRQALFLDAERPWTLKLLAGQLAKMGRFEELGQLAAAASLYQSQDPEMVVASADVLRKSGNVGEAVDLLEKRLEHRKDGRLFNALGICQLERGNEIGALEAFSSTLSLGATEALLVEAHMGMASILLRGRSPRQAMDHLTNALSIEPGNADIHYTLGILHTISQDHSEAMAAYKRSVELAPQRAGGYLGLTNTLIKLGSRDEALELCRQAAATLPQSASIYHRLGELERELGNIRQALAAFGHAVALRPDDMETYLNLGRLQRTIYSDVDARATFCLALEREFSSAQSTHYTRLGIAFFEIGDLENAIDAYKTALTLDANDSAARVNLGWSLFKTGNVSGAITAYKTVLKRQRNSIAHFNLGLAYLAMGNLPAADSTYAEAVSGFGAAEAHRIGAVADLRDLLSSDVQAAGARQLLARYWSTDR